MTVSLLVTLKWTNLTELFFFFYKGEDKLEGGPQPLSAQYSADSGESAHCKGNAVPPAHAQCELFCSDSLRLMASLDTGCGAPPKGFL